MEINHISVMQVEVLAIGVARSQNVLQPGVVVAAGAPLDACATSSFELQLSNIHDKGQWPLTMHNVALLQQQLC
jgi:hypothetical protein